MTAPSRYRESRTLVRRLCRRPAEDRAEFKRKIARLREHFERFNVDTSELCQWLMGLRKRYGDAARPATFGVLGDFLLQPALDGANADEKERDRWRLAVFDDVMGFRTDSALAGLPVPEPLRDAMAAERSARPQAGSKNAAAYRLLARLGQLEPAHRLVLLKSAAEWVVARYLRGVENWVRQREEWEKEKRAWESRHPQLTAEIRDRFTEVFKQLRDDERDGGLGLRRKNPRICPYERLRENIDNCCYAGHMGHGPLCWRYVEFIKARKEADKRFDGRRFAEDAASYLSYRKQGSPRSEALRRLFPRSRGDSRLARWFSGRWDAYLMFSRTADAGGSGAFTPLNEDTLVAHGGLPHCPKIGGTWEQSKCRSNPHTELCLQYKRALEHPDNGFDDATLALERPYREWRALYLAGPRKPSFKYPSSRDLPMPKVFGERYHEIDWERSVLRLRLDDMREGEWIEFGFAPWPRGYSPSKHEVNVTSVHVNFVGARARVGFRFDARHRPSRFACSQDELDELRSRRFPRQSQDQPFLEAARTRLIQNFSGDAGQDLRLLAVDLGMTGAHVAFYRGRRYQADSPLPIVKINRAYCGVPTKLDRENDRRIRGPLEFSKDDPRGLRKEHLGRHLKRIAEGAAEIAEVRQRDKRPGLTLQEHDFRRPKRHIAWMVRDWARHNASRIIAEAQKHECDLVVFESLRGVRVPGYEKLDDESRRKKAEGVLYAYGRVRAKVREKAVERGMRVVTVPYFNSSHVCSQCGRVQENAGLWRKQKQARKFICEHKTCGAELNSDANAARVLAKVFWGEITLPSPDSRRPARS